jgi:hypothetical protein
MNKSHISRLRMLDSTDSVLKENTNEFNHDAGMVNAYEKFTELRSEIQEEILIQSGARMGLSNEKEFVRGELITQLLIAAGALHAYAEKNRDAVLLEMSNITQGECNNMGAVKLHTRAKVLAEAIADLNLDEVGFTQTEMDELNSCIANFQHAMKGPREGIVTQSSATKRIAELLREASQLLRKRVDMLMRKYKRTHIRFYNEYKSARKIVDTGVKPKGEADTPTL